MKKNIIISFMIISSMFISSVNFSQTKKDEDTFNWNGYLQGRYSNNYNNINSFSTRRAKFWISGSMHKNWFYKVQSIYKDKNSGAFTLQDVKVGYKINSFKIIVGQMIPEYSLQRLQPDYAIPLVERASAINSLIPSAETMARDIGLQFIYQSSNKIFHSSLGLFNGNGANKISNEDKNFLYTNKSYINIPIENTHLHIGYSVAYRKTTGLSFKKITGNSLLFSGDDFRWGTEARLYSDKWELQGEYLEAHLGDNKSWGYYVLADYYITKENLIAFSIEKYKNLLPTQDDDPWYIVSYAHKFDGDKIKLSFDNRIQTGDFDNNYSTTIQLQYFFN